MKLIIAGSRKFNNYELLRKEADEYLSKRIEHEVEIVSGMAIGADKLGWKYAKLKGYPVAEFSAKWDDIQDRPPHEIGINPFGKKYWRKAGLVRNEEMAEYADHLLIFWDGKSAGSRNMIEVAKKHKLRIKIIRY